MKALMMQLAVCLLLIDCVYFGTRIRRELQEVRAIKNQRAMMPLDSSLHGIDTSGNVKAPNGQLQDSGYLLFVIHRDRLAAETDFWNRVIAVSSGLNSAGSRIQYWGICDAGSQCSSYKGVAQFNIFGYLDPYQMHIVAKADTDHQALLYGRTLMLEARIPIVSDPTAVSAMIRRQVK